MQDVAVESFSANAQISFGSPVTNAEADLPRRAKEMLTALSAFGVRAKDVTLASEDGLFGYKLQFSLFGGASSITLTAEELRLEFGNGRTFKDWEVIDTCFFACDEHLNLSDSQFIVAQVSMHAAFFTDQDRNRFLEKWSRLPAGFDVEGFVVRTPAEPFEVVELRIERSAYVSAGIFLSCRGITKQGNHPGLFTIAWITLQELAERFELSLVTKD